MIDWHILVVPAAVLAVLLLFRFVGCGFHGTASMVVQPYADDVLQDTPVVYYRMQENAGAVTADDEQGFLSGHYVVADGIHTLVPILNGSDASTYRSLPIPVSSIQVAASSVMPKDAGDRSVHFNGSFLSANGSLGDLSRFSVDALVHPEWDLANERNFYCVIDYSNFVQGQGPPGPNRNAGFAVYAGPDNPFDLTSPICWQLWIGTGNEFARANPSKGGPGPLASAEDTYLAVQFNDKQAFLWAFTTKADLDQVKFEVIRRPYLPATDPDAARLSLGVGISGSFAGLIAPFPSPQGFIYPSPETPLNSWGQGQFETPAWLLSS
jgi:hypothetical protein